MSRRTFLENMLQEARNWDASDVDSPRLSSGRDPTSTNRASPGEMSAKDSTHTPRDTVRRPSSRAAATVTATTPSTLSAVRSTNSRVTSDPLPSTAATRDAPLTDNARRTAHRADFPANADAAVAVSRSSSPPLHTPLTVVELEDEDHPVGTLKLLTRRTNGHAQLSLLPETLETDGGNEQAQSEGTPASSMPRSASANHIQPQPTQRRSSQSMSTVPDVLVTPRAPNYGRFSNPRNGSGQSSQSVSALTPVATVARGRCARPGGDHSGRSDSINRMEASLIALQVELATEKRNNIEAEHHIMTLNTEVRKLRAENARLSREVAESAATPVGGHHRKDATTSAAAAEAAAVASASDPSILLHGDAAVAARRIEALEARVGEFARNLETKQREIDTKDERIRLLEHKLADQLLLQTGVHYLTMPAAAASFPTPAAQTPPPPQQQQSHQHNGNASLSGHNVSNATAAGLLSRRPWYAAAPDTALAGPKISTIRHVPLGWQAHPADDAAAATNNVRGASAVRRRSPVGAHAGGPSDDLLQLSPVPPQNEKTEGEDRTRTPPPPTATTAASSPVPADKKELVAGEREKRKTPVRHPSAHRELPLRPQSTRRRPSGSSRGSISATPMEGGRRVSRPELMGVRTDSIGSEPHKTAAAASPAGVARIREAGSSPSASGRLSARRPSVSRRSSSFSQYAAPEADGSLGRDSGRRSGGGHPAHLSVSGSSGVAANSAGAVYTMNQRALSTYRSARPPSATRSMAQQSVRSSTSTRQRPQIAFTSDGETSTMKGTTTTVMFRARDGRAGSNPAASDGSHGSTTAADPQVAAATATGPSNSAADSSIAAI
ncbi:hypothetical protein ABB37_07999 [Leptomonas pyrrhocoris]|uniref:Uncharacterized protein n=1 Tax=Leptomonas pyrrhocoris TaxID=157538 RepID=A0A0N1J4F7_LEPPY|nr:hypothetical protein ABB37_07999 [Leptomonas pyrrhocoris]KPA76258.1 hypothetical protein ABB37_07999 [Leptomonas pyrrhocoris]|eukprot:XP_015654697.1 hypothetical protein ABB37_07999 [Leptomonas pyrrhocoris]